MFHDMLNERKVKSGSCSNGSKKGLHIREERQ